MKKPESEFPLEVKDGSVIVKIYKVENKGRVSFTVSCFADGKRKMRMFTELDEAHAEAKTKARSLSKGELDVLHLGNAERLANIHAVDALKPTDIEIFTPLEIARFLTYSRSELVPFLVIGAFADLRSAEIGRVDWSEVHLAERFIEMKAAKSKTASRRLVPMSENLAKWLAPRAKPVGRVVPFENVNKQIGWLVEDTIAVLKAAAKKDNKNPEPAKPVEWRMNGLRHSVISYRVADIQDINQVALECGNSPAVIFKHYRELVRPAEGKKWFGIQPDADGRVTVIRSANSLGPLVHSA